MKYILILILLSGLSFATELTDKQHAVYKEVLKISSKYKDKNGNSYPSILASICLTETSFGKQIIGDLTDDEPDITKGSLGVMQVRVETAKFIGKTYKEFSFINKMSDLELAKKLLSDTTFNIRVATNYFIHNKNKFNSIFKATSAYNGGLKNIRYVDLVLKNLKHINKISLNQG